MFQLDQKYFHPVDIQVSTAIIIVKVFVESYEVLEELIKTWKDIQDQDKNLIKILKTLSRK